MLVDRYRIPIPFSQRAFYATAFIARMFFSESVSSIKKKKKGRERKGKKFSPQPINKVSRFLNAIRPFRSLYFSKGNETFPPFLPPVFRGITISGPRFGTKDSSARSSLSTSLLFHSIRGTTNRDLLRNLRFQFNFLPTSSDPKFTSLYPPTLDNLTSPRNIGTRRGRISM